MRDWTRDELQDCLPDLLHGRLSATDAAAVEQAVARDPGLAAELDVLRRAQSALTRSAPVIDVSRIVAALPMAPSVSSSAPIDDLAARRAAKARPMISQRFARAAALVVVVGGGSLIAILNPRRPATVAVAPAVTSESALVADQAMQLGFGASTDELSTEQLRALEADIRSLDGTPSIEPDVTIDLLDGESTS
jgi:anti-sigma factor RsiW